jgi:hypothetical protein
MKRKRKNKEREKKSRSFKQAKKKGVFPIKGKTAYTFIKINPFKNIRYADLRIAEMPSLKKFPVVKGYEAGHVKITLFSLKEKKLSAVTYIYEFDDLYEVQMAMSDVLLNVYAGQKRNLPGYLKRVRQGVPRQFIVDFETAT